MTIALTSDFRENALKDVITRIEPDLFQSVTGLTVAAFRRYENASLGYTGIDSHPDLDRAGGYVTVVTLERITDIADG